LHQFGEKILRLRNIDQAIKFISGISLEIRILGGKGDGFEEEFHRLF